MHFFLNLIFSTKLRFSKLSSLALPALLVGTFFVVGCGAATQFDLGIPASKSESFYFHMKTAAIEFGYNASINVESNSLSVGTRSGSITYQVNSAGDGLEALLASKVHQHNKEMEQTWLEDLEKSHDKILERARTLSKSNQAWN